MAVPPMSNSTIFMPWGFLSGTQPQLRDSFDFRQAYVKFHSKPVQFFAGRQLLSFGNERVIGISDWTQTSRSFDGFDLRIGDKSRVDLFSASVVNIYPTGLNMHSGGLNYHGVYGSIGRWIPRTTLEPCVLVKAMPRVLSQQNIYGTETEVTTGLRARGFTGRKIDYDVTGTLQRGSYSNDSIHAGSLLVKAGYMAASLPWKPHLLGEYDYATANARRDLSRIGTFDQQYPSNHNAFGLDDLFGFQNIQQTHLNLDLEPYPQLTLLFQAESLHVATRADGVYSSPGALLVNAPSAGFPSDDIGTGSMRRRNTCITSILWSRPVSAISSPGQIMTGNGHGARQTISWLQLTYRFKMN